MKNMRVAERIFNRPLMISEAKMNVILHVMGPRFNLDISSLPQLQAAVLSDPERSRGGYSVLNGVATIGIYGPLMHRVMASEFPSGGPTSYADIGKAFDLALSDDGVREIILDCDSPGGEVNGCFDLADQIYQARSLKPITAMVNEQAYSAMYLLASAAGRIIIPRTGGVGSIGVIACHADFSRAEDAAGITVTQVFAGARKADFSPHAPLSSEARTLLMSMVGDTYEMFVDTVARNRSLSTKKVRDTEAGMFEGKNAVSAGLADEVASVNKASLAIQKGTSKKSATVMSGQKEKGFMTITELKETNPALYQSVFDEGRASMSTEPMGAGGPMCGTCSCKDCGSGECGACTKKPQASSVASATAEATSAERTRMTSLAAAAFGAEPGARFAAIANKGLTAEDMAELGITLTPAGAGTSTDETSRAAMLAAIQQASPEGVKAAKLVAGEAADRSATASAIAAGGSLR